MLSQRSILGVINSHLYSLILHFLSFFDPRAQSQLPAHIALTSPTLNREGRNLNQLYKQPL